LARVSSFAAILGDFKARAERAISELGFVTTAHGAVITVISRQVGDGDDDVAGHEPAQGVTRQPQGPGV